MESTSSQPHRAFEIVALLALTLWVYWGSLENPFHFDDALILQSPHVTEPGDLRHLLRPSQTRQLTYLSFFYSYRLGGTNPRGYHLFSLLVHMANVAGIYCFVLLLTYKKSDLARNVWVRWLPLSAAAFFAIHPVQTEAVNYMYQRSTLLAAFFTLAALCAFLWGERGRQRPTCYVLTGIFFVLALASKEAALSLPLVFLAYSWAYEKDVGPLKETLFRLRWLFVSLGALAITGAGWVLYNLYRFGERTAGLGVRTTNWFRYLTSQIEIAVAYLRFLLWPTGLSVEHDPPAASLSSFYFWFCLALLAALVAVAVRLRRSFPTVSFLLLSFFIFLAPNSSIIPSVDLMFEHRLYLPMIAGSILLALMVSTIPSRLVRRRNWQRAAYVTCMSVILGVWAVESKEQTHVWGDNVRLWSDAAAKAPHKARAHYNLGVAYLNIDPQKAREEFLKTIELRPDHAPALYNLGWLEQGAGKLDSARQYYHRAVQADPTHWQAHHNLGNIAVLDGKLPEAIKEFAKTIGLRPNHWPALQSLATLQLQEGNYTGARATLDRLISVKPDLLEARYLSAYTFVEQRRFQEAEEELNFIRSNDRELLYRERIDELRRLLHSRHE